PATAGGFRPGFIDGETASADLARVQFTNRGLCLFVGAHLDECKPARTASHLIAHDGHRLDRPRPREQLLELGLSNFVRQISDRQLPTHNHGLLCRNRDVSRASYLTSGGCRLVARLNFRRSESGMARYA